MIGLDTNFLVALLVEKSSEHTSAVRWLNLQNDERLATTSTNAAEVLRLLTHPQVFPKPALLEKALDVLASFIESHDVALLEEPDDWLTQLSGLAVSIPSLRGNEVFDARIALCLRANNVKRICTRDADFKKYSFLQIMSF